MPAITRVLSPATMILLCAGHVLAGWRLPAGLGQGRITGQFEGYLLCREEPPNPPAGGPRGAGGPLDCRFRNAD